MRTKFCIPNGVAKNGFLRIGKPCDEGVRRVLDNPAIAGVLDVVGAEGVEGYYPQSDWLLALIFLITDDGKVEKVFQQAA